MIEMSLRTFIIKVLAFITSNLLSIMRFGRHPTIKCSKNIIANIFPSLTVLIFFRPQSLIKPRNFPLFAERKFSWH